jgi:hypothetical protein
MRKLLLSIFTIATLASATAGVEITVEKADLQWTIGNKWYMAVTPSQNISSFTSSGNGVAWDLSSFEASTGKDTIVISAPTGGSGSVVNLNSSIIPETNYTETPTNYSVKTLQYTGTNYPIDGSLTIGLSHTFETTWSEASTLGGFIAVSVDGEVIADGQITTSFGTFDCVLVEETYNVAGTIATYYYWETKEYGRIAYLVEGNLSIMVGNNFNAPNATKEVAVTNFNVYPNPSTDQFTVKGDLLDNVKVFDAIGNLVLNTTAKGGSVKVNTTAFKSGLYFVQATSGNGVSTKSVVVK